MITQDQGNYETTRAHQYYKAVQCARDVLSSGWISTSIAALFALIVLAF